MRYYSFDGYNQLTPLGDITSEDVRTELDKAEDRALELLEEDPSMIIAAEDLERIIKVYLIDSINNDRVRWYVLDGDHNLTALGNLSDLSDDEANKIIDAAYDSHEWTYVLTCDELEQIHNSFMLDMRNR